MGSPFFPGGPVAERDGSAAGGSDGERIHRKRWKSSLGRRISIRLSAPATNGGERKIILIFYAFMLYYRKQRKAGMMITIEFNGKAERIAEKTTVREFLDGKKLTRLDAFDVLSTIYAERGE